MSLSKWKPFVQVPPLPLVSEIVEYKGKRYMDGGLSDSLPIDLWKIWALTNSLSF